MKLSSDIVTNYYTNYEQGDTSLPKASGLAVIAGHLDSAMESVVEEFSALVTGSAEHEARVNALKVADCCAGSFKPEKVIMKDVSEFEQMLAFKDWLHSKDIRKVHTFHLAASSKQSLDKDDHIPVFVRPRDGSQAGMMNVMLGATRGERVAPKYTTWSALDPHTKEEQEVFIRPLRTLEVIRQPEFSFAKVLKEVAQEQYLIDNTWAYGKKYWSVEGPGQSKPVTERSLKYKSSAFNMCSIVSEYSSVDDPQGEEVQVNPEVDFTAFSEEGYYDDLDMSIYASDIIEASKASIMKQNPGPLKKIAETLAMQFIGPVKTAALSDRFVNIIDPADKHN